MSNLQYRLDEAKASEESRETGKQKGPTLSELASKVEKYFRYNPKMEEYLRTNPKIQKFFIKLAGDGDSRALAQRLCITVLALNAGQQSIGALRPKFENTMRGLEDFDKTIVNFATKLRDNIDLVFNPNKNVRPVETKAIPDMLERFAPIYKQQLRKRKVSPSMTKRVRSSVGYEMRDEIASFVERETGKPHYDELAGLFIGTAIVLGIDATFDSETLKVEIPRWRKGRVYEATQMTEVLARRKAELNLI
jgi:hypothetical protein